MNSEFPETRLSKIAKRLGWIFSPLLLITLVVFTLFIAEGLRIDLKSGTVERKGSVEIKDLKNGTVFISNLERGKTPNLFDFTSITPVDFMIKKEGRTDWKKTVTPRPGFVKTFYPILFPRDLNFTDRTIEISNSYANPDSTLFFYERKDTSTVRLFRYSVGKQIFGIQERSNVFADITNLVREAPTDESTALILKKYTVLPSNNGRQALVVVPGDRAYVVDERGNSTPLANISPKEADLFSWSPSDSHIIYKTGNELYTVETSSNRLSVVHRPHSGTESITIQFFIDSGIVYTIENESITDLVQNSFEGNNLQKIELPNIDNIRKKNLVKAYNMLEKQGIILIQSQENIYSYDPTSFELKKFNRFKGEEIVFVDPEREYVVTVNATNLNQFRFYDLEQKESKSFTFDEETIKVKPDQVVGFNGSQNLIMRYGNKLVFVDIDGANISSFQDFSAASVILATKIDDQVLFVVKDKAPETPQPTTTPPTSTTTPSPTSSEEPSASPTQSVLSTPAETELKQEFVLRFEKFTN